MATSDTQAPPALPPRLQDRLGYLLGISHGGLRAIAEGRLLEELGLAVKQFGALTVLAALDEPPSQQALAELIRVDRTTMVMTCDALEAAGYVERRRNPRDRREQLLHLTAAGQRARKRAERIVIAAEKEFLSPLSAGDAAELRRLLQIVAAHHGRGPRA
jgi:DNA-binding MarR family transcriptional regulator